MDYLTASNRKGLGDDGAGLRRRHARRRGQGRRRGRRRRHGDGLRAHGGAPGGALGPLPLPPRPREHARLDAGGDARRGGGRRVRLALVARGCARRYPCRGRPRGAHSLGRRRRERPPDAAADTGLELFRRRRPAHQGARLRPRGPAHDVRGARARDDPLGHAAHRLAHHDDEPRRGLRHRRHRAGRLAGGLGDQGRARRRGFHPPLHPGQGGLLPSEGAAARRAAA